MEKQPINTVYVITVETMYKNGSNIYSVNKCYYREDEAKEYVKNAQKIADRKNTNYILWEEWNYEEVEIK